MKKKLIALLLSVCSLLTLCACGATVDSDKAIISLGDEYFNSHPVSSEILVDNAPFTNKSLTYAQRLYYCCIRISEDYAQGSKAKQKMAKARVVLVKDVKRALEQYFSSEYLYPDTAFTKGDKDTITFDKPKSHYTPVFELVNVDKGKENKVSAVYRVSKIGKGGKSTTVILRLNLECTATKSEIKTVRYISATVS